MTWRLCPWPWGTCWVGLGAPRKGALLLERAIKIGRATQGKKYRLAGANFAMAQALWAAGERGDRARSYSLAREALAIYQEEGGIREQAGAEVARWLAQHEKRR